MRVLKEAEFNSIKQYIDDNKPKNPAMFFLQTAKLMDRYFVKIGMSGDCRFNDGSRGVFYGCL